MGASFEGAAALRRCGAQELELAGAKGVPEDAEVSTRVQEAAGARAAGTAEDASGAPAQTAPPEPADGSVLTTGAAVRVAPPKALAHDAPRAAVKPPPKALSQQASGFAMSNSDIASRCARARRAARRARRRG